MSGVYAIADLHGQLPPIPGDCETLLIVGDICPDFDRGIAHHVSRQSDWLKNEFRDWLHTTDAEVVACWGNHDFVGEHPQLVPDLPWTLLQDSETVVNGLRVFGTPWVPGLPYWAFFARDEALAARAESIPAGLDVLMTHGPPYGAGDFIATSEKQKTKYNNFDGIHVGDRALTDAIARAQPRMTVCGHIHEARGVYRVHGLVELSLRNVAAVDDSYELFPQPFVRLNL